MHNFSFPVNICIFINLEYWAEYSFKLIIPVKETIEGQIFTVFFFRVTALINLEILQEILAEVATCNFIKKETLAQVFSCEFCEIFNNTFFYRTPSVAASISAVLYFQESFF